MNAVANSFSAITSQEKLLRIPFFQRKYVWGKEQWEKLWDDLLESFENKDSHFLGSVILKQSNSATGSERLVIDEQQRLTTFTILLKAIKDSINEEELPDLLVPSIFTRQGKERSVKIEHSKHNYESFSKVMFSPIPSNNPVDKIVSCYNFFKTQLTTMDTANIANFAEKILNDKIWVHITVDENEDEQRIFDSINTSGLILSEMDVVKNFLFRFKDDDKMEKASKLYDEQWKPVFDENEDDVRFWDTKRILGRVERSIADVLLHCIALIEDIYNPSTKGQKLDKIGSLYKDNINDDSKGDKDFAREDLINKILA